MDYPWKIYRPATHPINFAADSPDKIIAALRGRYFSFLGTCQGKVPPSCCARPFRCLKNHWGFHCYATLANANRTLKISWADRTWYRLSVNAAAQTGAGTSFGANGDSLTWAAPPLLIFCALTIRKQLPGNDFERSGRGQEPSRGHKFSILENFLSIRDFTSSIRLHFRSDLVGPCLPQTLLTNFLIILDFYFHYAILKW